MTSNFQSLCHWSAILAVPLLIGACTGVIGESTPGSTSNTPDSERPDQSANDPSAPTRPADPFSDSSPLDPALAGPMPLRRLTRFEYSNTVRDLFGETTEAAADRLGAERIGSSGFAEAPVISSVDLERIMEAAEALATLAVQRMSSLLPCEPSETGEDECARQFVASFGLQAFRRPLAEFEVADLLDLFSQARRSGATFDEAAGAVVEAILQAPQFLYRWELGFDRARSDGGAVIALGPYEVASRLSYTLWGSMPDRALFAAARAGELATAAQVEAQARRMLQHAKALSVVERFHAEWLGIGRVVSLPIDDEIKRSMQLESRRFLEDLFHGSGGGRLDVLLRARHTFVDSRLADFYGIGAPADGSRVDLPAERSGLLTHASVLATSYDLIHRGLLIRQALLCQPLPPPPADVPALEPEDPSSDPRERFVRHSRDPACSTCHRLIDPIGFGFEHFDSLGRRRASDGPFAVDVSGEVLEIDGTSIGFEGVPELARVLFESPQVRQCIAKQWFRYGFGRRELSGDAYSIVESFKTFEDSGFDLRELLVAYVTSRTFRYRAPSAGELLP
jgi:hypothetical protein